ncbi:hypothetical protein BRC83_04375 [Halobacteriales archaeon QS_1_68_17]|nr:MAG: hypothetical protein BRC83_04375 [Halobacteriales archaeon QS_1_68_17]
MAPVAVLYGTTDGRTAIAAERIAGVLDRFVVKPITGTAGGTDSSRDCEYTDRDAVDGFAADSPTRWGSRRAFPHGRPPADGGPRLPFEEVRRFTASIPRWRHGFTGIEGGARDPGLFPQVVAASGSAPAARNPS